MSQSVCNKAYMYELHIASQAAKRRVKIEITSGKIRLGYTSGVELIWQLKTWRAVCVRLIT